MSNTKERIIRIEDKLDQAIQLVIESTNQLQQLKFDIDQPELPEQNVEEDVSDSSYQQRFDKLYNDVKNDPGVRQFFDDEEDLARSIRKYLGSTDDSHSEKKESEKEKLKILDLDNDKDFEELSELLAEAYPDTDVKILVS